MIFFSSMANSAPRVPIFRAARKMVLLNFVAHPAGPYCMKQKTAEPSQPQHVLPGTRRLRLPCYPSYPFTGMVTGFASLNVN